jgi:acyl carrier protein
MESDDRAATGRAEVERRVQAFLQDELLPPGLAVTRDTELLSGDVLDSMGALRLSAFVGEEFGIPVRPSDFVVEHFRSVAAVAAFVLRAAVRDRESREGPAR